MQKAASGCGYTVLLKAITTGAYILDHWTRGFNNRLQHSQPSANRHAQQSLKLQCISSWFPYQVPNVPHFPLHNLHLLHHTCDDAARKQTRMHVSQAPHIASIAGKSWQNIGYISLWTRLANKVVSPWLRSYLRNSVRLRWHTVTCIPRTARWHKVRHLYAATLEDGSHVSVLPQVATTPALWKPSPTLSDNFLKSVDWHTSQQCTYVCTHVRKVSAMHVLHQVRLLLLTDS